MSSVRRARCVLSPRLCEVTEAHLVQAGWETEAWGPATPPKPDSAQCTGVQASPFSLEENGTRCPPGWPPKPGPQARWWGQHFFPIWGQKSGGQPEARHRLRDTGRERALPRTCRGAQGSDKGRGSRASGQRPQQQAPLPRQVTGLGTALRDAGPARPWQSPAAPSLARAAPQR